MNRGDHVVLESEASVLIEHAMPATMDRRRLPSRHLGAAESLALGIFVVATVGFGLYGWTTGSQSTLAYLLTVLGVGTITVACWDGAATGWVALALAALVAAHLAGGMVRVGNDVLYNASFGTPALRYDHLVHSSAVFLATIVVWTMFIPPAATSSRWPRLLAVCLLAGLGLGALIETIEFLTTLAHHGAPVGGYVNTGWDLVSNVAGAVGAGLYIGAARPAGDRGAAPTSTSST